MPIVPVKRQNRKDVRHRCRVSQTWVHYTHYVISTLFHTASTADVATELISTDGLPIQTKRDPEKYRVTHRLRLIKRSARPHYVIAASRDL